VEPEDVVGNTAIQWEKVLTIGHIIDGIRVVIYPDTEEIIVAHIAGSNVGLMARLSRLNRSRFEALNSTVSA
jgi:hypothetical protein